MAEAVIFNPLFRSTTENDSMADARFMSSGDPTLFDDVFKAHFKSLYIYAHGIVKDDIMAEEVVQHVFYKLWEKKEQLEVQVSIKSYLYRAVHNECINYLRRTKVREDYKNLVIKSSSEQATVTDTVTLKELQQKIDTALNELPEQCRIIFQLSRYEEMNYKEIADRLDVSVSVVKNQVAKALRVLRIKLSDYLPITVILIVYLKKMML